MISQSDFTTWLADGVTKAFRESVASHIERVKEDLAFQAGLNSTEDNFKRGYIRALFDVLAFHVDEVVDD